MTYFDEDGFIAERQIKQASWRRYSELRSKMQPFGPAKREHTPPGLLEFQTKVWLTTVARGNLQRVLPAIRSRYDLCEDTIYEAVNGGECSDAVLTIVEDAIDNLIFSDRFDVPTEAPTEDNLGQWLQRWVGSYNWIGAFLGVKPNTIAAWVSRGPRKRLLDFAQRWHEAKLALWHEKPQEQFEAEWLEYLEDREEWAQEALEHAGDLERADLRQRIEVWEATAPGQLYLEDVQRVGDAKARAIAFKQGRPHPKDMGCSLAGKLVLVERSFLAGQQPTPPKQYEDLNKTNETRFGPPAPADELWSPAKTVDA